MKHRINKHSYFFVTGKGITIELPLRRTLTATKKSASSLHSILDSLGGWD